MYYLHIIQKNICTFDAAVFNIIKNTFNPKSALKQVSVFHLIFFFNQILFSIYLWNKILNHPYIIFNVRYSNYYVIKSFFYGFLRLMYE